MKRAERAKALFLEGYNCAQAVVLAFAEDAGVDESVAKAFSRPLGGGMGRLRQTCGAVSGAAVASGVLFPELTKPEAYALVQEIARRFAEKNGSFNCGELLRGAGLKTDTAPNPERRTEEYYKKRPCPELIYDAAEILEDICIARGRLKAAEKSE